MISILHQNFITLAKTPSSRKSDAGWQKANISGVFYHFILLLHGKIN